MKCNYLEVSVVAKKLNVSSMTVYRLIQGKKLLSVRNGPKRAIRVTRSSLEEFERSRESHTKGEQ